MTIDLEERLRRAAVVLDEHIERVHLAPYVTPRRRSHSVGWVAVAAGVLGGLGLASLAVLRGGADIRAATMPEAGVLPAGTEGWESLPASPIAGRFQHVAVATESGLFVWGGYDRSDRTDGAFFEASTGDWRAVPNAPLAGDRGDAIGVWTGSEVVVLNGVDDDVQAAAFDPVRFEWRHLPDPPLANAANAMNRVLSVGGMIVVVGVSEEGEGGARNQVAVLEPAGDQWQIGENPPVSFGSFFDAVATNDEVLVVAGRGRGGNTCGETVVLAYRPAANAWRELPAGPAAARVGPAVAWTGSELFVGGGRICGSNTDAYDPSADLLDPVMGTWRSTAPAPIGVEGNARYAEVWTGESVAVVNRDDTPVLYHPATNTWHVGPQGLLGGRHRDETPWAWVDGRLVLFGGGIVSDEGGGVSGCCQPIAGGEAYQPPPGL